MATINSPIRRFVKPLLFKILGKKGYVRFQTIGKIKDIDQQLIDESEMELYPSFLDESSVSVDIGANYAYHTHRLAKLSPKGKVFAFEPIPFTFQVCQRIIKHYKLNNVALYQLGVGEKDESLVFELPLQDFGMISAGQSHLGGRNNEMDGKEQHYKFTAYEEVKCDVVALDSFKLDTDRLDFIKMDIEGAEFFALKGMRNVLEKYEPIVLLEINPFFLKGFGIKEQEMKALIEELGYLTFTYDKATGKLKAFEKNYVENNYYLVHKNKRSAHSALISA